MTITIDAFKWRSMTAAINQLPKTPRLLQDMVFRTRNTNPTETIDVDIIKGGRKILPFVRNDAAGTIIEKLTGEMRSVKAPRLRPKKPFTATELLTQRGPGKIVYANGGDVTAERNRKIGQELADLKNRVDTTIEFMCAQALQGSYSVSNDGYNFSIDFQMPSAHKPVLGSGSGWNESGGNIMDDIDTWATLIRNATGLAPDIALCGSAVVKALRDNAEVRELLDNRRTNAGTFTWKASNDYIGNLNGIDLYRYGMEYQDLAGADQNFLDANKFVLISTQARFSVEFALILDLDAGAAIQGEYFSKSWLEKDPSVLFMLAESRPLPVPWQPEAIVYADVIV
ncbi:major capsid protein [Desulforhopalus singaporensis]|uniref:Phage major capsid protein E n=1 Tax=Desulforhopalus singaporensis TaxID=91360 RepID=A0A1H0VFQ6_9BACT|nr:major capsid protein [Desulforhopalus singaporensis]SDP77045.1 Phage major capsid protein E [Desulforhopalus singaporensis]SDP78113.1 Phage major capsid protein E [Desulforhopalus singaporensis]